MPTFPTIPSSSRFPAPLHGRHPRAGARRRKRFARIRSSSEPSERLSGELPLNLTLQKRELDVFSRPDADELIERYNNDQPTFVVYGVATDYCVLAAVDGLLQRHCRVAIVADAVRAIDATAEAHILTEFAREARY